MYNGTNLPAGGGVNNISTLTTSPTLSFTNCSASASGLYSVLVTVKSSDGYSNSILSVPVPLTVLVLSPIQKANVLGPNAGFENNPVWAPWSIFNGIQFATAASFYDFAGAATDPVNVFDGTSCAWVGDNGDRDNGFYAQFAASPGSLWKAGGYAYVSTTNDFVQGNTCRLQIWFLNSLGGAATPGTRLMNHSRFMAWVIPTRMRNMWISTRTAPPMARRFTIPSCRGINGSPCRLPTR
jgi:hypothetical protein